MVPKLSRNSHIGVKNSQKIATVDTTGRRTLVPNTYSNLSFVTATVPKLSRNSHIGVKKSPERRGYATATFRHGQGSRSTNFRFLGLTVPKLWPIEVLGKAACPGCAVQPTRTRVQTLHWWMLTIPGKVLKNRRKKTSLEDPVEKLPPCRFSEKQAARSPGSNPMEPGVCFASYILRFMDLNDSWWSTIRENRQKNRNPVLEKQAARSPGSKPDGARSVFCILKS